MRPVETVNKYREAIERYLDDSFKFPQLPQQQIFDAMRYSLNGGGKRIRPVMLMAFAEASGADPYQVLPFACALEMIHTYSLIHDDLPCMDDDDLRRGKSTNHKVFGEAMAVLAGDGLLTAAFEYGLDPQNAGELEKENILRAMFILARAAGALGMVGGQCLDIAEADIDPAEVHVRKTGALIEAAALMGCILAGADDMLCAAAREYAYNVGLAFQIKDDLLDATGDTEKLGKPTGSDEKNNKITFYTLYGETGCTQKIIALTEKAKDAVKVFKEPCVLRWIADMLVGREN